jgi:hypothetical protein
MIARWRALTVEHGSARVAALYSLHRALGRLSGSRISILPYLLVAQPVGNRTLAEVPSDPNTIVRRIAPDDPVVADFPRPRHVIEQRFANGAECHVAWVKGRFAGHIWIARGQHLEDEVRCVYEIVEPRTGVWDFDVYVVPALRLGRVMARMWKAVDQTLSSEGVQWTYSRINLFNVASIRSHQRLGAVPLETLTFVMLGSVQICLGGRQPWRSRLLTTGSSARPPRARLRA